MVPSTIEEAAALQYAVTVHCRCGHAASFNSHGLWWRFSRKGWDQRLRVAARHFYCWNCWVAKRSKLRPVKIGTEHHHRKSDVMLEFPPQHEWRRAQSRMR